MKRAVILFAAVILLLAGLPVFSQNQQAPAYPKDAYVKTIPLEKLWVHQLGYKATFFNSHQQMQDIYIPMAWFNKGVESKADIVYDPINKVPYISIFWVDGKFDHITIYALVNFDSPMWGVLSQAGDLTSEFNVQEVPPNF